MDLLSSRANNLHRLTFSRMLIDQLPCDLLAYIFCQRISELTVSKLQRHHKRVIDRLIMTYSKVNSLVLLLVLLVSAETAGQELFILNEPASSVPKGVVGVRVFTQNYKEHNTNRGLHAFRVMYGATARLSLLATA